MGDQLAVRHPSLDDPDLDPAHATGRFDEPAPFAAPGRGGAAGRGASAGPAGASGRIPVSALLGLHRAAGNAAVVQMLARGRDADRTRAARTPPG